MNLWQWPRRWGRFTGATARRHQSYIAIRRYQSGMDVGQTPGCEKVMCGGCRRLVQAHPREPAAVEPRPGRHDGCGCLALSTLHVDRAVPPSQNRTNREIPDDSRTLLRASCFRRTESPTMVGVAPSQVRPSSPPRERGLRPWDGASHVPAPSNRGPPSGAGQATCHGDLDQHPVLQGEGHQPLGGHPRASSARRRRGMDGVVDRVGVFQSGFGQECVDVSGRGSGVAATTLLDVLAAPSTSWSPSADGLDDEPCRWISG